MRFPFWRKALRRLPAYDSQPAPARRQFVWAQVSAGAIAQGGLALPEVRPAGALPETRWRARIAALQAPWTLLALSAVAAIALASRLRYVASFDGTYGSGDAHGILLRALFLREGNLSPAPQLVLYHDVFGQPPLLPAVLALVGKMPGITLDVAPLFFMPALTIAAIVVLCRLLARTMGLPIAFAASLLLALLPRWSFDSTEPEKAPAVVSLFILALASTEAGNRDRRFLPLGGFFMGLSMLTHTTAYFFLPVLIGSYLAWNAGSIKRVLNWHAAVALTLPLTAVVLYFSLARAFPGQQILGDGASASDGVLPPFVQTYADALRNLATGGFGDSAWGLYFTGIRHHLGAPLFVCALGGLALASSQILLERRWQLAPYVLWAALVTFAFAIQYPASSHGSRYPSYVTPVYIVLACYFALRLGGLALARRNQVTRATGICALLALVGYSGVAYTMAPDPGLRDLYASHAKAAAYIDGAGLLDDGSGMLYMGWPSITFNLLEARPDYEDRLFSFGFGSRDLSEFTPAFLEQHKIDYYLYDHTGRDIQRSADTVLLSLQRSMILEEIGTFRGRPGSYSRLYRLHEKSVWQPGNLAPLLLSAAEGRGGRALIANEMLCGGSPGRLPGWEANGNVTIGPPPPSPWPCGVLVKSSSEYGGVRQSVDAADLEDEPFSVLAVLRFADVDPARTAVVAVYDGGRLVVEARVDLVSGQNYVAVEGYRLPDEGPLKVVVATGADDRGDLVIDGVLMRRGLVRDLISQPVPSLRS